MLDQICAQFRIDQEYWDIWGRRHETSEQTKRAILSSLGLDSRDDVTLVSSLEQLASRQREQLTDPVVVLSQSQTNPCFELRLPETGAQGSVELILRWEEGGEDRRQIQLDGLETQDSFACLIPLPTPLKLGYHDLEILLQRPGSPEIHASSRLIVAPDRAYMPSTLDGSGRLAGLAISLYGLRSGRNWGVGDFTDLAEIAEWAAKELRVALLALNPLHAIHNREPYNLSPYLPLSSFFRNYIYLDVERVGEFPRSSHARELVKSARFQSELARLRASEFVEYETVTRIKKSVLRLLFREFLRSDWRGHSQRGRAFAAWRAKQGPLLERFATYCAIDEVLHARNRDLWIWPDWPEEFRDPDSPAVSQFRNTFWRRVLFHEWLQWNVDLQLESAQRSALDAGMPVGLYHDLALATDRCGADFWAYRKFFVDGCRVGSPPDGFSPDGQDWAFPPPNAEAHREAGYELFIESIRKNTRHGGALRIDHVMRFFRLFWIPEGLPAKEGTYVREPWQDLLRILALESVRGKFLVVGEDLGTCPPEVTANMHDFGILSYKLFYFEKGPDGLPRPFTQYERQSLVSSTTHDLPTLAGFWSGRDIEARRAAGLLPDQEWHRRQWEERRSEKRNMLASLIRDGFLAEDFPRDAAEWPELTGELHNAIIGFLVSTPSMVMLLNQEDLTKETEQQNLPGTTWQYPNWKRKMKLSLEELRGAQAAGFVTMFRSWLEKSGRIAHASGPQSEP